MPNPLPFSPLVYLPCRKQQSYQLCQQRTVPRGEGKRGAREQEGKGKRIARDREARARSARWVCLHCMRSWAAPAQGCRAPRADPLWVRGCPRGCHWYGGTPWTRCYITPVSLVPVPFHEWAGWETGWSAKCRLISRTEAYYFYYYYYFNFYSFALRLAGKPRKTPTVSAWGPVPEGESSAVISSFRMRQDRGCPVLATRGRCGAAGRCSAPASACTRAPRPGRRGTLRGAGDRRCPRCWTASRSRIAAVLPAHLPPASVRGAEAPPQPCAVRRGKGAAVPWAAAALRDPAEQRARSTLLPVRVRNALLALLLRLPAAFERARYSGNTELGSLPWFQPAIRLAAALRPSPRFPPSL